MIHDSYQVVWNGGPLTEGCERDYAVMHGDGWDVIYWPQPVVMDWDAFANGGGWGILAPFDSYIRRIRRDLARRRRLHGPAMHRLIQRRLVAAHRHQENVKGERAPNVKLREEQVIEMRTLYHSTGLSFNKLAKRFAVSTPTVAAVIKGDTWKHLPMNPLQVSDSTRIEA